MEKFGGNRQHHAKSSKDSFDAYVKSTSSTSFHYGRRQSGRFAVKYYAGANDNDSRRRFGSNDNFSDADSSGGGSKALFFVIIMAYILFKVLS